MTDTRAALLTCALRLFMARGYEAVGVQEIVEAAGVTKPTLYHYFGSKRGLLETLLAEEFNQLYQDVRQAADYHGDLPLTLEKVTRAYFNFARSQRDFYRFQLALWFSPSKSEAFLAAERWNQQLFRMIEALFAEAVEQHGNMRGRQRAYAATLVGMINTYIGLALNGYTELDEALLNQAVHQFMHGIFS
jgi:AcrR family transcriptional regulator